MIATNNWISCKLGEIAPPKSCPLPSENAMVWNLSLHEVESKTGRILARSMCRVGDLGSSKCCFDHRHVLYSKLRPYLNKVALPDSLGVGTSELIPLMPDPNRLDREFLAYYLRSAKFVGFANANTRGANLPRIAMSELWDHEISFPASVHEQQRIVNCIDTCMERVDEIESLHGQSVAEADALLPSILNDSFIDLCKSHSMSTIGDLAEETRYGTSKKCSTSEIGVAILRIPNVAGGFIKFENLKYCELTDQELCKLRLKSGDLLFVRTNGSRELVGRCAIFEGFENTEAAFASYLIRVRLVESRMRPHFLAFFLNSTHGRIELDQRRRTSAGQFNINSTNLRSIEIPVPPLSIQDAILERLIDYQASVIALQAEIESSRIESAYLRDAILRKAFAGEL